MNTFDLEILVLGDGGSRYSKNPKGAASVPQGQNGAKCNKRVSDARAQHGVKKRTEAKRKSGEREDDRVHKRSA